MTATEGNRSRGDATRAQRRRFLAALGLFLAWVAVLGTMAAFSGRRPAPNPSAIEDR